MFARTTLLALVLVACSRGGKDPVGDDVEPDTETDDTPAASDTAEEEEEEDSDPLIQCDADLEILILSTGERVPLGCADYVADATFEYDPDTRPEIRTAHVELIGRVGVDVECRLVLDFEGLCTPEYYGVPTALRASLQTFDCAGIPDNMEGEYELRTGYARLDEIRTNGASGAGAGVPLKFNIAGAVELLAPGNLVVQGTFDVEPTVIGRDAEENDCRGTEDDLGAPVLQGEVHTVFDYKRAFEDQFPDCEADVVYEHVLPTVNHNGCPSCSVVGTVRPRRIAGDCEIDTDTLEMGLDVVAGRLWTWDDRLREWTNTSTGTIGYRQYGASFEEETNRYVRNDTITMTW